MADDKKLATELESREVAEQAREQDWEKHSFARLLFEGRLDISLVHPAPEPDPDERVRAGDFLTKHNDHEPVTNRKVAYVLNFAKDWREDWGGYLQFFDGQGNIVEGFKPRFNCLNMFCIPMDHSVSYVPPFCQGQRLAITGWFNDGSYDD